MIILDDTYTFSDFGLVQEEGHDHPPMPNFSNNTVHIPKRAGRWDFGIDIQEKPFNIPLATESWDRVKLQQRLNEFVAFLFDQYGQPREFKLTFDYEPEKYYMVKLREGFNPERVRPYAKFILPLVANDPYKKLAFENHEINWDSTIATYDDDWSIDTVYVNEMTITKNQTVETYVNGLAIRPDIYISGSGNNVTLSANGKSFKLKNFTNANFLIRGKDYTCFKNGIDTLTEMTGDHLTLNQGLNEISIIGSNMNFNLSIILRDQFN